MTETASLSADQAAAVDLISSWAASRRPVFTLGGLAGTGKTTTVRAITDALAGRYALAHVAPTNQAARVLAGKLPGHTVSTVHGLIYQPLGLQHCPACPAKKDPEARCHAALVRCGCRPTYRYEPRDVKADIIICDEASMVSDRMHDDLLQLNDGARRTKILYVGDHGQLAPVMGGHGVMHRPDHTLSVIHRTDHDGIIKLAHHVRETGKLPRTLPAGVIDIRGKAFPVVRPGTMVLAATNALRQWANTEIRAQLGRSGPVQAGDRVICLTNDREQNLYNGAQGVVTMAQPYDSVTRLAVELDGARWGIETWAVTEQFGSTGRVPDPPRDTVLWDFANALTVHKAQGSEADRVILIDKSVPRQDPKRWLYTGITRAKRQLAVWG